MDKFEKFKHIFYAGVLAFGAYAIISSKAEGSVPISFDEGGTKQVYTSEQKAASQIPGQQEKMPQLSLDNILQARAFTAISGSQSLPLVLAEFKGKDGLVEYIATYHICDLADAIYVFNRNNGRIPVAKAKEILKTVVNEKVSKIVNPYAVLVTKDSSIRMDGRGGILDGYVS